MNSALRDQFLSHIDSVLAQAALGRGRATYVGGGNATPQLAMRFNARALAAIARISGPNSEYSRQARQLADKHGADPVGVSKLGGVLQGLRQDLESGYLDSVREIIHGELFGNFLDRAQELLDGGYKDPAAVIAGSVLENHLRELCVNNNIPLEGTNQAGNTTPKKADTMNADLAEAWS
jgi:hypothetical protein